MVLDKIKRYLKNEKGFDIDIRHKINKILERSLHDRLVNELKSFPDFSPNFEKIAIEFSQTFVTETEQALDARNRLLVVLGKFEENNWEFLTEIFQSDLSESNIIGSIVKRIKECFYIAFNAQAGIYDFNPFYESIDSIDHHILSLLDEEGHLIETKNSYFEEFQIFTLLLVSLISYFYTNKTSLVTVEDELFTDSNTILTKTYTEYTKRHYEHQSTILPFGIIERQILPHFSSFVFTMSALKFISQSDDDEMENILDLIREKKEFINHFRLVLQNIESYFKILDATVDASRVYLLRDRIQSSDHLTLQEQLNKLRVFFNSENFFQSLEHFEYYKRIENILVAVKKREMGRMRNVSHSRLENLFVDDLLQDAEGKKIVFAKFLQHILENDLFATFNDVFEFEGESYIDLAIYHLFLSKKWAKKGLGREWIEIGNAFSKKAKKMRNNFPAVIFHSAIANLCYFSANENDMMAEEILFLLQKLIETPDIFIADLLQYLFQRTSIEGSYGDSIRYSIECFWKDRRYIELAKLGIGLTYVSKRDLRYTSICHELAKNVEKVLVDIIRGFSIEKREKKVVLQLLALLERISKISGDKEALGIASMLIKEGWWEDSLDIPPVSETLEKRST